MKTKLYKAMIWEKDLDAIGKRVEVHAVSLAEAREKLERKFGEGKVYNLHNEEDAEKPRGNHGPISLER